MKLTIKSLQQSTFTIDVEPEMTVKELKDKIEREQGKENPSGSQKLIYSGKILADEKKLAEYEFDEKKFVVLMITKPPPAPKKVPDTQADSKSKTNGGKPSPTATSSNPASDTTTDSHNTTQLRSSASIPLIETSSSTAETRGQQTRPQTATRSSQPSESIMSFGEQQITSRLAALMSQPHFRQIQDMIQQSPHLLSATIESLAGSDPDMYSFISENPDVFVSALNNPPLAGSRQTEGSTTPSQQSIRGSQRTAPGAPVATGGRLRAPVQIEVSEHDKEAIERLKELGFSEYLAVQAYMACDKDEQLAANLLFQMEQ